MGSCCVREDHMKADEKQAAEPFTLRESATAAATQPLNLRMPVQLSSRGNHTSTSTVYGSPTHGDSPFHTLPVLTKRLNRPFHRMFQSDGNTKYSIHTLFLAMNKDTKVTMWVRKLYRLPDKIKENEPETPMNSAENTVRSNLESLRTLSHPCVLQANAVLFNHKEIYVLSESFTGAKVVSYTEIAGKQSESMVKNIAKQLFRLINYLHAQNIVLKTLSLHMLLFYLSDSEEIRVKYLGAGGWETPESEVSSDIRINPQLYVPAEGYSEEWTMKSDIWSCGMILLVLLTNTVPIYRKASNYIQDSVLKGVKISTKTWVKFDPRARLLITAMLATDPAHRPTAAKCLAHPWLQDTQSVVPPAFPTVMTNLRRFKPGSPLQLAVLTYIATHALTPADKQTSQELFEYINTSGSGVLSPTELQQTFSQVSRTEFAPSQVAKVFQTLDIKGNGVIDFTDFLIASTDIDVLTSTNHLQVAFSLLDPDNGGTLTVPDLIQALNEANPMEIEALVHSVDIEKNGTVNVKEFMNMVKLLRKEGRDRVSRLK